MIIDEVQAEKRKLEEMRLRLRGIEDCLKAITTKIDGLPKGTNFDSRIEKLTAAKVDLEEEIMRTADALTDLQIKLTEEISTSADLNILEKEILIRRYVTGEEFKAIWREVNVSEPHCYYLHRRGLAKMKSRVGSI